MTQYFYPISPEEGLAELDDILGHHRREAEKKEEAVLCRAAARSADHRRYFGREDDHRLPYKRDVDRILHSKAYARYIDKTQVVYLVENDHLTQRGLHVQLVSNFARGIAEILGLNVDLVEAIALGHDVGHPPFGHEGETYLCTLSVEGGNGPFCHSRQSCRLLSEIEPLNLGLAVYDGFLCHDGGSRDQRYEPKLGKSWDDHFAELELRRTDPEANLPPATLEGCLVKLCDTASYLGRDIEDALRLGIIEQSQIPKTRLGTTNREILGVLAGDIIRQSYGQETVALSDDAFAALRTIRKFNFESIYFHPRIKVESAKVERSYRMLFEILLDDWEKQGEAGHLWTHFLDNKPQSYLEKASPVQQVVDYLAGMTNGYFIRTLRQLVVPSRIEIESC